MVYTITCNAVLIDLSGTTIDELSYADTHMVQINFGSKPVPTPTDILKVESEKPVDTPISDVPVTDSNEPIVAPRTGDTEPLGGLLIAMALKSDVLIYDYAFNHKKRKTNKI